MNHLLKDNLKNHDNTEYSVGGKETIDKDPWLVIFDDENLHEFSFCRSALQNIRDSDAWISICKVWVVPAPGDSDTKSVTRDSLEGHVVELPSNSLSTLQ